MWLWCRHLAPGLGHRVLGGAPCGLCTVLLLPQLLLLVPHVALLQLLVLHLPCVVHYCLLSILLFLIITPTSFTSKTTTSVSQCAGNLCTPRVLLWYLLLQCSLTFIFTCNYCYYFCFPPSGIGLNIVYPVLLAA